MGESLNLMKFSVVENLTCIVAGHRWSCYEYSECFYIQPDQNSSFFRDG